MEYCTFTEPQQGFSYDEQLAFARATERAGFDGFFRSDHFMRMGAGDPLPGPTDAWTTLAGPGSRDDPHPARHAGLLRHPSGAGGARHPGRAGRRDVGRARSSSGWAPAGSRRSTGRTASRFPTKRFDLFEEQLAIVTGLWSTPIGETFDFAGEHYTLARCARAAEAAAGSRADHRRRQTARAGRPSSRPGTRRSSTSDSAPSPRSPRRSRGCAPRASASTAIPSTLKLSVALPTIAGAATQQTLARRAQAHRPTARAVPQRHEHLRRRRRDRREGRAARRSRRAARLLPDGRHARPGPDRLPRRRGAAAAAALTGRASR